LKGEANKIKSSLGSSVLVGGAVGTFSGLLMSGTHGVLLLGVQSWFWAQNK
jgi:hypothetical protein